MDIINAFVIQVSLSLLLLLLLLWALRSESSKTNKEAKNLKKFGALDFFQLIYMLTYAKAEIVSRQKVSRFLKVYKKYFSPLSMYLQKPAVATIFGVTGFLASDFETICQINKNEACNDRLPDSCLELYSGGRPSGFLINNNGRGSGVLKTFIVKKLGQLGLRNKEKMTSILTEQLSELLNHVETVKLQGNNKIQVVGLFSAAVINIIANSVFGKNFSATDAGFIYAHETFNGLLNISISNWVFLSFLSKFRGIRELFGYSHLVNVRDNTKEILKSFIKERKSLMIQMHNNESENIIDFFLEEIEKQKNNENLNAVFNEKQLVTTLQDLMLAGIDTTSKFLESLLMFMCLHPEVQVKVQNEIDLILGTTALPLYYECKSRMNYTMATFWEVHRLTHQVPFVPRMTTKDVEIAGHHLLKGTVIINNYLGIRLDEAYWKKPFVFYPENFLDDNGMLIQEKVERLLIFSSDARACPGKQISNAVSFTFGVGILQKYTVRKGDDNEILGSLEPPCIVNGPQPFHVSLLDR